MFDGFSQISAPGLLLLWKNLNFHWNRSKTLQTSWWQRKAVSVHNVLQKV